MKVNTILVWPMKLVNCQVVSEEVQAGTEIPRGAWGRGRPHLTLHSHHQNDSCIKMGSNARAILMFNCEGQSHKTVSANQKKIVSTVTQVKDFYSTTHGCYNSKKQPLHGYARIVF